jgi:hypothetical protein
VCIESQLLCIGSTCCQFLVVCSGPGPVDLAALFDLCVLTGSVNGRAACRPCTFSGTDASRTSLSVAKHVAQSRDVAACITHVQGGRGLLLALTRACVASHGVSGRDATGYAITLDVFPMASLPSSLMVTHLHLVDETQQHG